MGFYKRVPQQKFKVRPDNRPKGVAWAQAHKDGTDDDWFRTVFSDESFSQLLDFTIDVKLYYQQATKTTQTVLTIVSDLVKVKCA